MECAKIKQLLSEYVDGTLDEQRKAIIEGHLVKCKFCSEELVSLKAYVKPRIKISIKVAAVAAAVVLAIFVFKVVQPAKEIPYVPLAPEPEIIAEKPKEEPIKIARKEEVTKTAVFLEAEPAVVPEELTAPPPIEEKPVKESIKPISVPIKEEKPIELALLIEPEAPTRTPAIIDTKQVRLTDILSMIKNLTSILEGEIISVEYKEGTKIPQHITAKIPSKNYKAFLQKLALYGSVESPPEGAPPLTEEAVSVKIKLAYPE